MVAVAVAVVVAVAVAVVVGVGVVVVVGVVVGMKLLYLSYFLCFLIGMSVMSAAQSGPKLEEIQVEWVWSHYCDHGDWTYQCYWRKVLL